MEWQVLTFPRKERPPGRSLELWVIFDLQTTCCLKAYSIHSWFWLSNALASLKYNTKARLGFHWPLFFNRITQVTSKYCGYFTVPLHSNPSWSYYCNTFQRKRTEKTHTIGGEMSKSGRLNGWKVAIWVASLTHRIQ